MRIRIYAAATLAAIFAAAGCGQKEAASNDTANEASSEAAAADDKAPAGENKPGAQAKPSRWAADPFPSTYEPYPSVTTLIRGATVLTGAGERIDNGSVLIENGKIAGVGGADLAAPEGANVIDANGKWVTPGVIDIHSHLGDYPSPSTASTSDGNEATAPNTAQVWAEHSVWPQDAGFTRALAGGVTSLQILPGSANLFGGRTAILKNVPSRTVQGMKFPGAPYGLKMACGENPKRFYADKGGPSTRMGNFAGYRAAWIEAAAYKKKWEKYWDELDDWNSKSGAGDKNKKDGGEAKEPEAPTRDLKLETLAMALSGDITVNMHCYRADEMAQVIDMSREFGYKVSTFHHGVEAYKIADILAENGICAAVWADWWGFKLEAYDAIRENAAMIDAQPGSCTIIHSDDEYGIQRLNQEAGKAVGDGAHMGLEIPPERAIEWITLNPAKAMRIADRTGSLEAGKMADVVIWDRNPFSIYAKTEKVFIDGALLYDASDPARSPRMDFEIGQQGNGFVGGSGQ
ncbi:MAG: amidohydrolase [Parvularculaceae bacterium]|nr:amidohydrolase [Parvularculaceae bacterium]